VTRISGRGDCGRRCALLTSGVAHFPNNAELLRKLKQVEDNAWMLFSELPPCVARTRALHVYLDAKELKSRFEALPLLDNAAHR
jgi:hypothetical protein